MYHRLSGSPISRQDLLECLTLRRKLSESVAYDLIEEIKVDFGAYERDNMIALHRLESVRGNLYLLLTKAKVITVEPSPKKKIRTRDTFPRGPTLTA